MKFISKIIFVTVLFISSFSFAEYPWEIDFQTKEIINAKIEKAHKKRLSDPNGYYIDYFNTCFNFSFENCPYCQNQQNDIKFEKKITKDWFRKVQMNPISAHCFGISVFFIKYLLCNPQIMFSSGKEILSGIANQSYFKFMAHNYSANQPVNYQLKNKNNSYHIFCYPSIVIKYFFLLLMNEEPIDYYFLSVSSSKDVDFDQARIYATLSKLSNKLLLVNFKDLKLKNGHSIVVSTYSENLFCFDPNLGLFRFYDLETLSYAAAKYFENCQFRYLISFSLKDDKYQYE